MPHAPGLKIISNIICFIVPTMLHAGGTNNSATLHAPGLKTIMNIICILLITYTSMHIINAKILRYCHCIK